MSDALIEESEVKISGFGELKPNKAPRIGRNPKTEERNYLKEKSRFIPAFKIINSTIGQPIKLWGPNQHSQINCTFA